MKESARIAATVARQKLKQVDPKNQFFNGGNLHLHVPEVCFYFVRTFSPVKSMLFKT